MKYPPFGTPRDGNCRACDAEIDPWAENEPTYVADDGADRPEHLVITCGRCGYPRRTQLAHPERDPDS